MRRWLIVFTSLLMVFVLAACGGGGGNGGGSGQADQLARGQEVYTAECAECHDQGVGPDVTSASAPFLTDFANAQELFSFTHDNMPMDAPGSLTDDQYYDVVAHMLQSAGVLPADTVVGPDTAAGITFGQ
ncbi:MAG TPA: cytochrome c [Chloroflexi bacterium]|nr:cytochrome c [Chloroflexota bacterium]HPO57466.1 cytochrome c [Anaerolineaceae bacterium]